MRKQRKESEAQYLVVSLAVLSMKVFRNLKRNKKIFGRVHRISTINNLKLNPQP